MKIHIYTVHNMTMIMFSVRAYQNLILEVKELNWASKIERFVHLRDFGPMFGSVRDTTMNENGAIILISFILITLLA